MKKFFTLLTLCTLTAAAVSADDQTVGIYLSGTMNDWAENDAAWEFKAEPETPGWAYIDLSTLPAGTEFRIVGQGRNFGMKNTRNTIRRNSMHLMTLDGTYNLTACDESLDGVHLMVQTEGFATDKYIGILTITDESKTLYGACMQSSVTPTLLQPIVNTPNVLAAEVDITEPWYVVKAYQLSNATQTVCNYGLSDTDGILTPTSNLAPTAPAIPLPAEGPGKHIVHFNYETYAYWLDNNSAVGEIILGTDAGATYYNLRGIRVDNPEKGGIYIRVTSGRTTKVIVR